MISIFLTCQENIHKLFIEVLNVLLRNHSAAKLLVHSSVLDFYALQFSTTYFTET